MSDKIKFKFPENHSSWNNYFTTLEEKIELSEDDELLINREWITRKIKAKAFKWERWEKWEQGEPWERWLTWPKWETWERWEPFRYSDFTEEQLESLKVKWDKWEPWEKWDPWKNFEYSDFTEEQLEGLRWPQGLPWRDWTWAWDMLSTNNLSDLGNIVVARKNLEVFSEYETGRKIENELAKENFAKKWSVNVFVEKQIMEKWLKVNFDNWISWMNENWTEWISFWAYTWGWTLNMKDENWNVTNYFRWKWNSYINWWNVWIWTTTPSSKLDVKWNIKSSLTWEWWSWTFLSSTSNWEKQWLFWIRWAQNSNVFSFQFANNNNWVADLFQLHWGKNTISIHNIPTSPAWLSSWMLYRDWDIIKIVP